MLISSHTVVAIFVDEWDEETHSATTPVRFDAIPDLAQNVMHRLKFFAIVANPLALCRALMSRGLSPVARNVAKFWLAARIHVNRSATRVLATPVLQP